MTIKEEPQIIEFTYSHAENENLSFNITYDPNGWEVKVEEASRSTVMPLKEMVFPVDFFKEVYEYFVKKGVIKGVVSKSFKEHLVAPGNISPPQINRKDEGLEPSLASSIPAFSSFDIPVAPSGEGGEQVKVAKKEEKIKIDRPVIRSRKIDPDDDDDAIRAEQEYASQRGSPGKVIKSRHGN